MDELAPLNGEVQKQLMAALWRVGSGTVDDVRAELPSEYRGAYTTVQTMLNRLAERGLLTRRRQDHTIVYEARISEADYLSQSIKQVLVRASPSARSAALAELLGDLAPEELSELRSLGEAAETKKGRS